MMRRINRAARLRGIRLMFTGYSGGYGAEANDSNAFRNRRRYPDGEPYACVGSPGYKGDIASTMGSCVSNRSLLRLKQREMVEFVRRVEPGAMYIHSLDISTMAESNAAWKLRCTSCRRKWPSDDVAAADGMAGAFAWFYEQLAGAINKVTNPRTGYSAKRDCLLIMVSPNYASHHESDREWREHCNYFEALSSKLKTPNICLGLREQFVGHGGGKRFSQLRRRLDKLPRRPLIANLFFHGGDTFYNSHPFIATPIVSGCFDGADMVVNFNGNAYHEPQQLLNAEYTWNPRGSAFHQEPIPRQHQPFNERYVHLIRGEERPAGIFATGGLLDVACDKLYGPRAGSLVADIHRLRTGAVARYGTS
jgi:hypothetical protein